MPIQGDERLHGAVSRGWHGCLLRIDVVLSQLGQWVEAAGATLRIRPKHIQPRSGENRFAGATDQYVHNRGWNRCVGNRSRDQQAGGDVSGIPDDQRDMDQLPVKRRGVEVQTVLAQRLTVIRGNDDEGVVRKTALLKPLQEKTYVMVSIVHSLVILVSHGSMIPGWFGVANWRTVGIVGVHVVEKGEEWMLPAFVVVRVNPAYEFIVDHVGALAH